MTLAYINGQYLPLEEVKVSAMDRGFLFGDGVYEVIPVYNRVPLRLEEHLRRLAHSLTSIKLTIDITEKQFQEIFSKLISANSAQHQTIYLQVTRGPAPVREHVFPSEIHPTIFAFTAPLVPKTIAELSEGFKAITTNDVRWQRCDIKAITLLANVLAKQEAQEANAIEAIFVYDGFAIEGCATNLFIVKDGVIITPPADNHILGGITRELVLELARDKKIPYREELIPDNDLFHAEEVWLTSSSREIMPIISVDSQKIGNGQAGPLWYDMIQSYQHFKNSYPS